MPLLLVVSEEQGERVLGSIIKALPLGVASLQHQDADRLGAGRRPPRPSRPEARRPLEVEEEVCLGDGCYEFIIYDSYGDGICCSQGQGQFQVIAQDGSVYGEGGNFDDEDQVDFCIEANSVGENPLLIDFQASPHHTEDLQNSVVLYQLCQIDDRVRISDVCFFAMSSYEMHWCVMMALRLPPGEIGL